MKHRLLAPIALSAALSLTATLTATVSAAGGDPSQWGRSAAAVAERKVNEYEGQHLTRKVNEYEGQHLTRKVNEYEGQH